MSAAVSIRPIDATGTSSKRDRYDIEDRIRRSNLHSTAVRLLLAIAKFAGFGRHNNGCYATTETLLDDIGRCIQARQAGNLITQLEKDGWITVVSVGKSKFSSKRRIFLGPKCWPEEERPAPSNSGAVHLVIPYAAPSNPVPAFPLIRNESRKTTTEPRGALSFSSRSFPEPPIAAGPATSHDIPSSPAPVTPSEFDQAAVKTIAQRLAALGLPGLSAVEAAACKLISLRREAPGRPPAAILDWTALAVADAEARAGGKDPVENFSWFVGAIRNAHADGFYTPGTRKPPVTPAASATVWRAAPDTGPKPPDQMSTEERDQAIAEAAENVSQAEENLKKAPNSPALRRNLDKARDRLAELEKARREQADPGCDIISMRSYKQ